MRQLANHLNHEQALKKIAAEPFARQTISFYRYVQIDNPAELRDQLFTAWSELGVLGRVYLSQEGINAQISVPQPEVETFRKLIDASPLFTGVEFKYAIEEPATSFWKLIIKVRKQIVADDLDPGSYDLASVGTHLNAKEFNQAIDQGALVVDMRNKYESDIGHFENAVKPSSQTFGDELQEVIKLLDDKKNEKVLLYCTGGIRCEKASAFLKHNGFNDVSQLYGGIINYKHEIEQAGLESKFKGKNFVFDGRMAEAVTSDVLGKCFNCKNAADTYDNCSSDLCHALFIQCADCKKSMLGACSMECRAIAALPLEERKVVRKGRKAKFKILSS
ncbi:MAG: rhodanese-related sulfurtransferase [Patescibacteria group bacterium]